ncbi:hypothetical protein D915_003503 [Fasciola hepatica]|uniref:Uncharacterized protein n=1 Tax=Fasciola hepatica TaxID=6192 RepID=A0A4E0S251_FASHE|nr:hypothetical protein D915_003503 [Fasciola hepatica]
MIRRIVDSVSLLADADGEQLSSPLHKDPSTPGVTVPSDMKITLRNRSASSTESSDPADVSYTSLFTSYGPTTMVSSSGSCYVAQKPVPKTRVDTSDDEQLELSRCASPIPPRRQSPSPGRVDPSCVANRQLPGGPSLQQRVQRTQPIRKKEHSKCVGPSCKPSRLAKPNKNSKSEEVVSTYEEKEETRFAGMASQADPLAMSVECYVLPFLQDLKAIELRIPEQNFSKTQRRILKMLANENELLIMPMSKPGVVAGDHDESVIVVRKRAALQQRQEVQWEEEQRKAAERARQRAEEEERRRKQLAREELIRTNQLKQETSCQANFEDPEPTIGRKKARRMRRDRRRQADAKKRVTKPKRVDSEMQTVPEDHWLCPWCWQHIPPEALCGHEVVCRAGVRLKQKAQELKSRLDQRNADAQARRRQRLGLPPLKTPKKHPAMNEAPDLAVKTEAGLSGRSRSRARNSAKVVDKTKGKSTSRPRSRSSSKTDPRNQTSVVAKLETVHPNDLEGMIKLMQRVCSQPGCDQLYNAGDPLTRSAIKCLGCRLPYCDRHRPVGMHTACPKPEKPVPLPKIGAVSTACGWDIEEKRAALKSAIRERRAALQERRRRYY